MAERVVFLSCGLLTHDERQLAHAVARTIERHGMRPFAAQEVHSAGDLNSNVFEAIRRCHAFLGIMHKRGAVSFATYPLSERSSVWIQQEFAIFCYRMFLERHSLPVRIYAETGIRREGVMDIALANPIDFDDAESVVANVDAWLSGPEFTLHPVLSAREGMFRRRFTETNDEERLILELLAAHCLLPDDSVDYPLVSADFVAIKVGQGLARDVANARFSNGLGRLREVGLVGSHRDARGEIRVWIAKQWFALLLDELRGAGRLV